MFSIDHQLPTSTTLKVLQLSKQKNHELTAANATLHDVSTYLWLQSIELSRVICDRGPWQALTTWKLINIVRVVNVNIKVSAFSVH